MAITKVNHKDVISSSKDSNISGGSGIYFLVHDNRVVYVGQSLNVISRSFGGHNDKTFDGVAYIIVEDNIHLNNLEAYFIGKFKPKYNSSIPSNKLGLSKKHLTKEFDFEKVNHLIENQYGKLEMTGVKFKDYDSHIDLHLVKEEYDYTNLKIRSIEQRLNDSEMKFEKMIKEGYKEIGRISKRIGRLIDKEKKLQCEIDKKNQKIMSFGRDVIEMSEEISILRDKISVQSDFEPSIDIWNKNMHAVFGVYIKGVRNTPFYYFVSNNPLEELGKMRDGKSKSKSEMIQKTFKFLLDQGIQDKIELRFEEFITTGYTKSVSYEFLSGKESQCFNCNTHRTRRKEAELIWNDIVSKVVKLKY